ncbi:MAG: hypothetical protein Q7J59_03905 [Elusimicrobiota bacterium]|nr:hypothetical protein [Elusimicrobiota bacterium]
MNKTVKYLAVSISFIAACSSPQKNLWEEIILRDGYGHLYFSSSELENRGAYVRGLYGAHNLFDGNSATCWSEGAKDDGLGESVSIAIKEETKIIVMQNGYAKSDKIFKDNNRIKQAELSILAGIHIPGEVTETGVLFNALPYKKTKTITLEDSSKPQKINFPFKWKKLIKFKNSAARQFKKINREKLAGVKQEPRAVFILRIKILSVYPGDKYDDTCLSSISFENKIEIIESPGEKQTKIYVDESQNAILMTDENGRTETLVRDPKSIFQIVDVSADGKWLIAIHMPADISHTRVETDYRLYNTEMKKQVPQRLIADGAGELYGFDGKGENIFLMYADNKEMTDKRIALSGIYYKIK